MAGDLSVLESAGAWLSAAEVSKVIGCDPNSLREQARVDPSRLGFPVCVMGSVVRVPKDGFVHWYKYGYAKP